MALKIAKGENFLVRFNLKQKDGTALLLSSLTSMSVDILQNSKVIESLTYPSANLRQGETTSQAEVEVRTVTSNKFSKGNVFLKTTIVAPDSDFDTEEAQTKVDERVVAQVV